MNPAIDKLLSQVYELEGLLLVIERHRGDVSPFIYEMIQKKAERIGELAPLCIPESKEETPVVQIPVENVSEEYVEDVQEEPQTEDFENQEEMCEVDDVEVTITEADESADDEEETFEGFEEESEEEPIKLDEALQRSLSKDLSRAFSLNDRFRYRRELFSNSEVEMRNTLNIVEAMQSYAEAEDYFYGDLEWDSESPEVKDFMVIIKNHFL